MTAATWVYVPFIPGEFRLISIVLLISKDNSLCAIEGALSPEIIWLLSRGSEDAAYNRLYNGFYNRPMLYGTFAKDNSLLSFIVAHHYSPHHDVLRPVTDAEP